MYRQNYFLGGIIESVVGGVGDVVSDVVSGVSDWFTDEATGTVTEWVDPDSDWLEGLEGGFDYWGAADETSAYIAPSFFDQASDYVTSGISDFFSAENIKKAAKALAGSYSGKTAGASAQQQARSIRSEVLGAGRGIGVSGSAPARQFTPGSVQSLIARTNAGKVAFQPGTVDTRQNLVNIVAEAFTETEATSPTGAGKISPSATKIEKVGTSYFS